MTERTHSKVTDDQIRCRSCEMWSESTRMRQGEQLHPGLLCDDCWYDWSKYLGLCRHCGADV